jgi:hypothetical protein
MSLKLRYSFNTIEKFLKEYVKEYKLLTNGEIAINSPFVGDTTFDCRINVEKNCFHDFESDESGNIEKLAAEILKVSVEEARKILLKYGLDGIETTKPKFTKPAVINIKEISLPNNTFGFGKDDKRASISNSIASKNFLMEKLVDYTLARKYKLRWTEMSYLDFKRQDQSRINMSFRIIIPTYEDGKLVYFQARDYSGKQNLRYKNPPKEIQPKSIIVPFYDLIIPSEILFISEGPWEAIQYGGTYMLGPVLSDRQILKIKKKSPKAIYFVPDNDETGRRKLLSNVSNLRRYISCPIYIVKWWIGEYVKFKDPIDAKIKFDDLIKAEFIEANRNIDLRLKAGAI